MPPSPLTATNFAALRYLPGFANEHASEALAGALPVGQFSPQQVPYGLYAEKFSATAFTAPRRDNRRTWLYRIQASVVAGRATPYAQERFLSAPFALPSPPTPMRWSPWPWPEQSCDFVDGLFTVAACGNAALHLGMAAHVYTANRDMGRRCFVNADGEMLLVPQQGRLALTTECGQLLVAPGEIALIPRGMKWRVDLPDGLGRGYVCENYGAAFRLPERGPVGSDGFANDRDFLAPTAAFEDLVGAHELITRYGGACWRSELPHSPFDVVAWVGTAVPLKYDLARFNAINTVTYDHPDPSIFTVLTAPSDTAGVANVDFVIFPPRWTVAEHSFRPPWYHRNVMSEFMGLVRGTYDARERGFEPGGISLHNSMVPHGPEAAVHARASTAALAPVRIEDTLAFMFESRYPMAVSAGAMTHPALQADYPDSWRDLSRHFAP